MRGTRLMRIITYWEMCTSWNAGASLMMERSIITYWEMCTSWNRTFAKRERKVDYNLLGNVH